jgi:hypothetical protein
VTEAADLPKRYGGTVAVHRFPHITRTEWAKLRTLRIGLAGPGPGAIIRHIAGAIGAIVSVLLVLALVTVAMPDSVRPGATKFLSEVTARNSLAAVRPVVDSLSTWAGLGMLCLYGGVLLSISGWLASRRDA